MAGTARGAAVRAYVVHLAHRPGWGRRGSFVRVAGLAACAVAAFVVGVALAGGTSAPAGPARNALEDLPTGWTELPPPPEVRSRAATAWTGEGLLVWSGYVFDGTGDKPTEVDGFAYDARISTWEQMAASPLAARAYPASAWTGVELLVWGGADGRQEQFFDDGAAYDPEHDTWRKLPAAPIGARAPLSVWTGDELLVWGTALRVDPRPRDGAAYDPVTDSWRTIAEAPIELTDATAVWTGREMIVFGAALHGGNFPETKTAIGAAYDPAADTWRTLPRSELSPQASTAAWTGRELIAWDYLNGSAAYHPGRDKWRTLHDVPLDAGECGPESVSLGGLVLGDYCGRLALYDVASAAWDDVADFPLRSWNLEIVVADPVFLLLGRNVETGDERMLAYRPR